MSAVLPEFLAPAAVVPKADLGARRFTRRLIVDEKRAVAGYQLVPMGGRAAGALTEAVAAPPEGGSALRKPTFVRCTCSELQDDRLQTLDPATVVLELRPGAEGEALDVELLKTARQKGFRLAFDARLLRRPEHAGLVPLATHVVLDMGVLELDRAAAIARDLQLHTKAVPVASQVRTGAQYQRLAGAGVKLFEGLWFAQPPERPASKVPLSYASLIKLLNMVVREAELDEIEELLKREPTLAFKLLQQINSCGFGRNVEITSFRHAVMTVGLKRLFRWTALLMTSTPAGSVAPAAGTLAVTRARLMELLALDTLPQAEADLAFVTGMFSLLDTLLGMPIEDALALVNLPSAVTDAILAGEGPYARYLAIARACEGSDEGVLEILSERHRIPTSRIVGAHLEALGWAEQFSR